MWVGEGGGGAKEWVGEGCVGLGVGRSCSGLPSYLRKSLIFGCV